MPTLTDEEFDLEEYVPAAAPAPASYTNDLDGKRFYELVDHSAFCLDVGDLVPRNGTLVAVTSVDRRPGGSRTVGFDNAPDLYVSQRTAFDVPVFYRPRSGF